MPVVASGRLPAGLILAAGAGRASAATEQLAELRGRPLLAYAVRGDARRADSTAWSWCSATSRS